MKKELDIFSPKVWVPMLVSGVMLVVLLASGAAAMRTGNAWAWLLAFGAGFVLFGMALRLHNIKRGLEVK